MFEIKVSPEKKKEIIEELEKQDWSWIEEEFGNDDNFKSAVSKLKEYGIVTDDLCKITRLDIEIPIEEEQQKDFERVMGTENFEFLKSRINLDEGKILMSDVSKIYNSANMIEEVPIQLSESMAKKLALLETTRYKASFIKEESMIKDNTIMFEDLKRLLSSYQEGTNEEELIEDMMYSYDNGMISEKDFLERLGSESLHPSIEAFEVDYEETRNRRVTDGVRNIEDFFANLENYKGKFSEEEISTLSQLQKEMETIGENVDEKEAFIDKWNVFAQKVWENYLEDENHMLVHVTSGPIKGKFNEKYMSTSPIVIGKQQDTYGERNGYIVKPKKIVGTMNQDSYTRNGVANKYYALNSIVVELPQQMEAEQGKGNTNYQEIVLEDFEYEGVITFLGKDEGNYEKLQEMAEAQGNLPIKRVSNGKCVSYEQEVSEFDDNQTQQEQTQTVVTQAKKQEKEISTNMWESRLEKFYGVIGRAPYNLKKRLIMKREEIVNAISNRIKQRDNRKENMER